MEVQMLINSGIFVIIMVRFASQMFCRVGLWRLGLFIAAVLLVNAGLMVERLGPAVAIYKAVMIAVGFLVGTAFMAYASKRRK